MPTAKITGDKKGGIFPEDKIASVSSKAAIAATPKPNIVMREFFLSSPVDLVTNQR